MKPGSPAGEGGRVWRGCVKSYFRRLGSTPFSAPTGEGSFLSLGGAAATPNTALLFSSTELPGTEIFPKPLKIGSRCSRRGGQRTLALPLRRSCELEERDVVAAAAAAEMKRGEERGWLRTPSALAAFFLLSCCAWGE